MVHLAHLLGILGICVGKRIGVVANEITLASFAIWRINGE